MKKTLLLFIGLLFSNILFAQQSLIKELNSDISKEKNKGKRAVLMSKLAETSRFINIKKSIDLAEKAINLSKTEGNEEDQAYAYIYSIKVFKKADSISQMVISADRAVSIAEKLNNKTLKGLAYNHKGFVEMNLNESQKSMFYFFKALENLEGTTEYLTLAKTYYYIYGSYAEKGDLENEQKYALLCLEAALKSNNPEMICSANQAMGTLFADEFNKSKNIHSFNKAISHFKKALLIFDQNSEKIVAQKKSVIIALNIANLYFENPNISDSKEMVLKYSNLALVNAESKNDFMIASNCYGLQSELAKQQGDYNNAERLLLKAKALAENRNFKNEYVLSSIYESLATFYTERKKPSLALVYYQKYLEVYKKLNDTRKKSDVRMLEAKFQTTKKEEQLILLTKANNLQKRLKYLYLALAVFAILGLLFLYRFFEI